MTLNEVKRNARGGNPHGSSPKGYLVEGISGILLSTGSRQDSTVTEQELARTFGTSRSPIREALKELEKEGLIERRKGKGITLRKLSIKEITEVYDVRSVSEGLAARLACENVKEEDLRELEKFAEDYSSGYRERDPEKTGAADLAFHSRVIELSGNTYLLRMMHNFSLLERAFSLSCVLTSVPPKDTSPYTHELIVETLRKGIPEESERVVRLHIQYSKQALVERVLGTRFNQ